MSQDRGAAQAAARRSQLRLLLQTHRTQFVVSVLERGGSTADHCVLLREDINGGRSDGADICRTRVDSRCNSRRGSVAACRWNATGLEIFLGKLRNAMPHSGQAGALSPDGRSRPYDARLTDKLESALQIVHTRISLETALCRSGPMSGLPRAMPLLPGGKC